MEIAEKIERSEAWVYNRLDYERFKMRVGG
jgi:hypothetical protein